MSRHSSPSLPPWRTHDWDKLPKPRLSISEVAELFGVEEHTLRYWEQETKLSPRRFSGSGARWYTKEDLLIIEQLYYLVEIKGLTLKAASGLLGTPFVQKDLEIRDRLLALRAGLGALRAEFESLTNSSSNTHRENANE